MKHPYSSAVSLDSLKSRHWERMANLTAFLLWRHIRTLHLCVYVHHQIWLRLAPSRMCIYLYIKGLYTYTLPRSTFIAHMMARHKQTHNIYYVSTLYFSKFVTVPVRTAYVPLRYSLLGLLAKPGIQKEKRWCSLLLTYPHCTYNTSLESTTKINN